MRNKNDRIKEVYEYITKNSMIKKGDNIILAVSGGPDSIFMLYALNEINISYKLQLNFVICNVNHNIREESIDDTNYVKQVGDKLNIPVYIKSIDIPAKAKSEKIGLEEAGRNERYKFFKYIGETKFGGKYKIAVAHNMNDNTESFFINAIRGAGIEGLQGIRNINDRIIRPILFLEKKEILEYLDENNIKYMVDYTNFENNQTRNSIRNEMIPYIIKKYNENIHKTIYRTTENIKQENQYLEKQAKYILNTIIIGREDNKQRDLEKKKKDVFGNKYGKIKIDNNKFIKVDECLKPRILRLAIKMTVGTAEDISKINLEDMIKLSKNNVGNKYLQVNKQTKISLNRGILIIENTKEER